MFLRMFLFCSFILLYDMHTWIERYGKIFAKECYMLTLVTWYFLIKFYTLSSVLWCFISGSAYVICPCITSLNLLLIVIIVTFVETNISLNNKIKTISKKLLLRCLIFDLVFSCFVNGQYVILLSFRKSILFQKMTFSHDCFKSNLFESWNLLSKE